MKRRFDLKGRAINRSNSMPVKPDMSTKGQKGGLCNRSACLAPGATWYNWGSLAHYCFECSVMLNWDSFNARDAFEQKGMALCQPTDITPAEEKEYHEERSERFAARLAKPEKPRVLAYLPHA